MDSDTSAPPALSAIVRELLRGPHRFTELRDALPGISPHTLTSRVRRFECHGIVLRTAYPEIPHGSSTGSPLSAKDCALSSTPWPPGS